MRPFVSFLKKEFLESTRNGKFTVLGILFVIIGIMNPAIAKLTPWLLELFAEEILENGMPIGELRVDALTSWTQFFKNIPIALIAFVFMYSGIFTKEYESETLVLILTKGLQRYKVLLSKALLLLAVWCGGYWLSFGITYIYNAYFWNNSVAVGLIPAVINQWIFGIFIISLMIVFSVLFKTNTSVLLGVGGVVLVSYFLSFIPKIKKYLPTSLTTSAGLLVGAESVADYAVAVIIAIVLSLGALLISIPLFNKKHI